MEELACGEERKAVCTSFTPHQLGQIFLLLFPICRCYLALCFGEVCVRVDVQKAPGLKPRLASESPAQASVKRGKALALGPSLLRLLSQVLEPS